MKTPQRTVAAPAFAALILLAGTSLAQAGNGSSVAVAAEIGAGSCSGIMAIVDIDVAVTAGSAAPVTFLVSTGGAFAEAGTFTNWTSHGRTKTAEETLQVNVLGGIPAQVTICASQPGANGNDSRSACTIVSIPVMCNANGGDWV